MAYFIWGGGGWGALSSSQAPSQIDLTPVDAGDVILFFQFRKNTDFNAK